MPVSMEPEVFRFEEARQASENETLRRKLAMQRAVIISLSAHLVLSLFFLFGPGAERRPVVVTVEPAAPAPDPPVAVAFLGPSLPAPPLPEPIDDRRVRSVGPDVPRPEERYDDVPLRMQPAPPRTAPPTPRATPPVDGSRGSADTRPAGGESGGDRIEPTPGVPQRGGEGDSRPLDLDARLRQFQRALGSEAPPPGAEGPEGSGKGKGGVVLPGLPPTGFGFGNLEFESRDYDWGDYARAIYVAIWRAWHNRLLHDVGVFERWSAQNRQPTLDHAARIRFTIERSGQVTGVAIETPSGAFPLDDSAADALREVVLPPLPADFRRDRETVRALFIAQGEIRTMRPHLEWLKTRGYF